MNHPLPAQKPRPYDAYVIPTGAVQDATVELVKLGGDVDRAGLLIVPGAAAPASTTATATVVPTPATAQSQQAAPTVVIKGGHLNFALPWAVGILVVLGGIKFGLLPEATNIAVVGAMVGGAVYSEIREDR